MVGRSAFLSCCHSGDMSYFKKGIPFLIEGWVSHPLRALFLRLYRRNFRKCFVFDFRIAKREGRREKNYNDNRNKIIPSSVNRAFLRTK